MQNNTLKSRFYRFIRCILIEAEVTFGEGSRVIEVTINTLVMSTLLKFKAFIKTLTLKKL